MVLLDDYNLVWSDEFCGDKLDCTKWNISAEMRAQSDVELREDSSAIKVSDGKLELTSDRISDYKYYTNASISTKERMSFNYGYLEMRAKVPFGRPAWPSFWMLADSECERTTTAWRSEVDIFEVFASDNILAPNIHKWYKTGQHEQCPNEKKPVKIFKDKNDAEQWHIYGLLWTPEAFNFIVDGEVYCKIDITAKGDFTTDGSGMGGFHDPHYIILNNYIFTNGYKGSQTWAKDKAALPDDKMPVKYYIDYIRLYQKKGEGKLIIKEY